ncbi:homeobox protein goosecoid-2 [Cynoglossus semilaevis]|uniref:homeobox protein goosecoid-2 n=1 Tax=Cynoglossus semilaevis TaxID=244447 RepID=UPI000D62C34E|nr:homeobox protein goosecoid-2 [Cynoglossus semilaevis]
MSFTIENILSKYPKSNCGRWTCDAGVKEKAGSPVGGHTETVHHALVCCCCYCSHCGDMLRYDFLHEDLLPAARLCGLPPVMLSNPRKLCESHRAEQLPVQLQRRTRRHRTIFTEEQLDALEELFLQNQYPDVNTREKLAQHTHLREERVEVRKSSVFV